MPETVLPCSCCGYLIVHTEDVAVRECVACGTLNARPVAAEASADILCHAVRQRLGCDFVNAERSYQHVLLEHPDESEALWGRLLCHYGVEYVEDPATGRLTPTVHTVRRKPLRLQPEFRDACEFAPEEVRARYEREAAYIDDAQAAIRVAAASCPPYDVFLCHKTTHPGTGEKTGDFHRATQLYYYLREQGLRPFFAPESLMGLAGADYEAGIYHAIDTAKVMLVLCSDQDWLTSPWVRSEWSRFIERIDDGADKRIVPLLYDHFSPAQLPPEFRFRRMQGFPMGELTSTEKLMALIREAVGKEPATVTEYVDPVIPTEETAETTTEDVGVQPEAEKSAETESVVNESVKSIDSGKTERGPEMKAASGSAAATAPALRDAAVGSYVTFGSYPQDADGGVKPVEWLVLEKDGERMLLVSRYGLDTKRYHQQRCAVTWETCSLRRWLNGEFVAAAFGDGEKACLLPVEVLPDANPNYETDQGRTTRDRVFLLSIVEAETLILDKAKRQLQPTAYARKRGGDVDADQHGWWWLRSNGMNRFYAASGRAGGEISERGGSINYDGGLVRPALWITLEE